ncbi:MAG TPA: peptide chain release factor N(5)-glutamine methyltransferase [Actinomycetota bacterium]
MSGLGPVITRAAAYLERHGVESPRETAEILLMNVLETDRAGLYARREPLGTEAARRFGRALCQRCSGVPLQHLTGEQGFLDLVLTVRPGVFVPRPETEGLVLSALETLAGRTAPLIVDVGTGTGAVALAIKHARGDARVLAVDRSGDAVQLARENADRLGLEVEVLAGDLLDPVPGELRGAVDLIVSNPPYIAPEEYADLPAEVRRDPYEALVGGTDVHRRLGDAAPDWLRPGGWLALEIGDSQGEEVGSYLANSFSSVEVLPDLAGRDRVVRARWREA